VRSGLRASGASTTVAGGSLQSGVEASGLDSELSTSSRPGLPSGQSSAAENETDEF
jgi:hypothetical protein